MLGTLTGGPLFRLLPEVNLGNVFLISIISAFTSWNAFLRVKHLIPLDSIFYPRRIHRWLENCHNSCWRRIILCIFIWSPILGFKVSNGLKLLSLLQWSLQSPLSTSSFSIKAFLFRLERRLLAQQRAEKREFTQLGAFIWITTILSTIYMCWWLSVERSDV